MEVEEEAGEPGDPGEEVEEEAEGAAMTSTKSWFHDQGSMRSLEGSIQSEQWQTRDSRYMEQSQGHLSSLTTDDIGF